jgi:hypothetical protein
MINDNRIILIGASGQNAGKTTLAAECIRLWKDRFPIVALKVTTISHRDAGCHRGEKGCGVCAHISQDYVLEEETGRFPEKDTARLLLAGARRVFWLRSLFSALETGFTRFLEEIPEESLIICESNSLRKLVQPGCFIMLHNLDRPAMKPSAANVADFADLILEWNRNLSQEDLQKAITPIQIAAGTGGRPASRLEKKPA